VRRLDVVERRARLARRHGLAPGWRAAGVTEAADRVVCLHATDPATVYLSARARTESMTVADLEHALFRERSLVKHLAMRRTLFVFPRTTLAVAQAGVGNRVAGAERRRLIREVEAAGLHHDGTAWLARASAAVLEALAGGREATSSQLRREIPLLEGTLTYGEGRSWGASVPVGPRVLTALSAAGALVRATNGGAWNASRPRWARMEDWLGEELAVPQGDAGLAALVERWLRSFGPGTLADLKWWLGSTLSAVRRALAALPVVKVDLDGATGYVLGDDVEAAEPVEPWAALLPSLDPTVMGWFERDWYLGEHRAQLFDTNGNAGPTAWWDGRIVGGWCQGGGGEVVLQLLEDPGSPARAALGAEAERLTTWLDGVTVLPRFPSPLARSVRR